MNRRIIEKGDDFHIEERTFTRSFDTLEKAKAFAEGKSVIDIYKSKGLFKVEYSKTYRVDHLKRVLFEGEQITPETAMKWFCWHEIVAAMEKHPDTLMQTEIHMNLPYYRNLPDWEYKFLRFFLEIASEDLVIEKV